jgi:pimeloyl-ACP methyl ester carboxylesterase
MPRTVMLYLSGFDTAEWTWHLKDVAGYDYATEMAQLGHVSLTVDMLGYGASDHPPGEQICLGSQADVTHQLITQLRSAQYTVDGGTPLAFSKVALAAHDVGGPVAEIEAYSYKDVDGLVLTEWVDAVGTPFILAILQSRTAFCLAGGEDIQPGGPGGYVFFGPPDEEFRSDLFHQADPAVVDAVVRLRSRNPCGYVLSLVPAIVNDGQKLGEITAPVLFLHPAEDPVWDRSAAEKQPQLFKGSTDVTAMFLDDTGHFPMFERTAPQFRATVSDWLQRRGF